MGLIEQEIKELREIHRDLKAGKVSAENAKMHLAISLLTQKWARLLFDTMQMSNKFGKSSLNRVVRTNLIGDGTAIEAGDAEIEMIKCPECDGELISRRKCLDYSGTAERVEICQTCENFAVTRKVLVD